MTRSSLILPLALPLCLAFASTAEAGTVTADGAVTGLDDVTQIASVTGVALFDEMTSGDVALDGYADQGMTLHVGPLVDVLPGVTTMGEGRQPIHVTVGDRFPIPIGGGGVANLGTVFYGGILTFDEPVTQFGMTAGGGMVQYLTAYNMAGEIIGQVTYTPDEELDDAAFVGIDTMGVPIAMLAIGNDDLLGGEEYVVTGEGTSSDTWMWGVGALCGADADCLDDQWSCTMHACVDGACVYSPTMEGCDDENMCTEMDTCAEGQCIGSEVDCEDGNVCTFNPCVPDEGCQSQPIEGCCFTDEDCPEGSMCVLSSNTCTEPPPPPPPPPEDTETDAGDEETESGEETGPAVVDDGGEGGCSCSSGSSDAGGLAGLGLLTLLGLGFVRRRR